MWTTPVGSSLRGFRLQGDGGFCEQEVLGGVARIGGWLVSWVVPLTIGGGSPTRSMAKVDLRLHPLWGKAGNGFTGTPRSYAVWPRTPMSALGNGQ